MADEPSRVIRFDGEGWESVEARPYKDRPALSAGVKRHTLLADGQAEPSLPFQVRYFEVRPGGFTSLERHRHPHAVVVLRGRGSVILGNELHRIAPFDTVYIAPDTLHQLHADSGEPLGFLCVVPRDRDRPRLATSGEIAALVRTHPGIAELLRRASLGNGPSVDPG